MRSTEPQHDRVDIIIGELEGEAGKYGARFRKSPMLRKCSGKERNEIAVKVLRQIGEKIKRGEIISREERDRMRDDTLKETIDAIVFYYIDQILISHSSTSTLGELREHVRSYRIIVLVGAGFSEGAGLPLTRYLRQFDFDEISRSKEKQEEFKEKFVNSFLKDAKVTDAPRIIARAFECKKIVEIVCLNWDDLIERAYREEFGKDIRKIFREDQEPKDEDGDEFYHYLWKFHGDAEHREVDWVLPTSDEKGRVFKSFTDYLSKLLKRATFIFLIIGYKEGEQVITDQIIRPIEESECLVYRIGLDLEKFEEMRSKYLFAPAEPALRYIFEGVCSQ